MSASETTEEFVNFIVNTPQAITIQQVQQATLNDQTLQAIMDIIRTGRWHECPSFIDKATFQAFKNARE